MSPSTSRGADQPLDQLVATARRQQGGWARLRARSVRLWVRRPTAAARTVPRRPMLLLRRVAMLTMRRHTTVRWGGPARLYACGAPRLFGALLVCGVRLPAGLG